MQLRSRKANNKTINNTQQKTSIKRKRAAVVVADIKMTNKNDADETAKKSKSIIVSLDKSRKKEVKDRLNEEARKEMRTLAVGTLAMMVSALSNQGMCDAGQGLPILFFPFPSIPHFSFFYPIN
jgi:hypothetical protein